MFKLKKVELLGFKSFADRTHLAFGDGTAAVVGPNGCGKSNLADAISWVLGEQSARTLRGERMSDVIFNGTGTRPPTSLAEVSLTLVDPEFIGVATDAEPATPPGIGNEQPGVNRQPDKGLSPAPGSHSAAPGGASGALYTAQDGAQYRLVPDGVEPVGPRLTFKRQPGEIVVTRRLFRSGESEYLLNGEVCRLRDVQDLFMGTGLGPESYAIIEQGRIGQILSSKPSDRRAIIEEAAGVSKFKSRKRLAEAKLESARQNLARITDILEEVSKQVNSLKRQASKARRYHELHDEVRARQKLVLTSRLITLESECQRLREELAAIQKQCSEAARECETFSGEQRDAGLRHEQLEEEMTQLRELLAQGDVERERLRSLIEQARQQAASLEARDAEASGESEQLQSQLGALEKEAVDRGQHGEQVRQDWSAAQEAVEELSAAQTQLGAELAQGENQIEHGRQALLAAVAYGAELRNQLIQVEEMVLTLDRQLARTEAERASVEQEHQRKGVELEVFRAEHLRDASTLASLTQFASQTAAALDKGRQEEAERRAERESLHQECSQAFARQQALEESLARHAYATEGVRRLLSGDIVTQGHSFRPLGVLADFVEVAAGYEEVVEAFLKHELDCVVVERHEEARRGIALLQSEGGGHSTFFVTHFPSSGHADGGSFSEAGASPRPQGVLASLQELVRFESRLGLNGDLALPALANAYLVEDAGTAECLAAAYPTSHFLTATGEHYHHRLVSGGKVPSAGPLALRRDFRELERRSAELESKLSVADAGLAEAEACAARFEEQLRSLNAAKLEAEKKAVLGNEKLRQADEALRRATERVSLLRDEAAAAELERKSILSRRATLRAQREAAAAEQAAREQEISVATQSLHQIRAQLDQLGRNLGEAQAKSSALEERALAIEAERSRLLAQAGEVRARLARLAEQGVAWREERRRKELEAEAVSRRLRELEAAQLARREQLRHLELESQTLRTQSDELRARVDAARLQLDARRAKRAESEVAQARADSDLAHLNRLCREELNAGPAALIAALPEENVLDGDRLPAAEEEVRQLKTRIESLGPVNMMALEELQEAEERFIFLEGQRQDLLASIADTTETIREIDHVSSRQFREAFDAINGYFAESFRTLLGGGIGAMRLSDEADPESGIDLVAQPPGKRLQNVLLLSGGEKALTALALLIAIFRFTPSPFCVLDEVDAPLDDSNVERFTRMIQQMSRHTQFVLITHNKRTMEICPLLYGVTMEEPGVSKLISVRFEAKEPKPAAVAL